MIEIMSQHTDGKLLAVKASKKLTKEDYEKVFIPALEQLLQKYAKISVVMYLTEGFEGWEIGAAWDDAKFGIAHNNDFEKVALVGGPKWVVWGTKLAGHMIKGEVRTFDSSELWEALDWVKEA
jgi:hypothetical protein